MTIRSRSDPPGTDYAVELITGLHAADIYLFDAASPQYRAVISKSYALDLSQSETLTEAAASYAPFLSEALYTPDGALAAVPMGDINAPLLYEVYLEAWRAAEPRSPACHRAGAAGCLHRLFPAGGSALGWLALFPLRRRRRCGIQKRNAATGPANVSGGVCPR